MARAFAIFTWLMIPTFLLAQVKPSRLQEGLVLKCLVREPSIKSIHPPVIILLHGVGSNEQDLFSLADQLPADALIISARAPIQLSGNGYGWYHIDYSNAARSGNATEAERSRLLIGQFIDQVLRLYHPDPAAVYLMGFSQGAIMSYSLAITEPQKIKGIIVLSGKVLDEIKPKVSYNDKLKKVAIFIGHGTADHVLPIQYAREAHQLLAGSKVPSSYHEYDMKHEISAEEMTDVKKWLASIIGKR